jgi:hypothetical protein
VVVVSSGAMNGMVDAYDSSPNAHDGAEADDRTASESSFSQNFIMRPQNVLTTREGRRTLSGVGTRFAACSTSIRGTRR